MTKMNKILKLAQINNNKGFFFIMFLLVFFVSSTAFAQKESLDLPVEEMLINQNNIVIENPAKVSNSTMMNSNVNFILWFMGTKDNMSKSFSDDTGVYSKKSLMTSGREPNRLLVKTLLKKALNIKSC